MLMGTAQRVVVLEEGAGRKLAGGIGTDKHRNLCQLIMVDEVIVPSITILSGRPFAGFTSPNPPPQHLSCSALYLRLCHLHYSGP
jgi:hypothetical protein